MESLVKAGERGVSCQLSLSQQGCSPLLHHIPGGGSVSVISSVVAVQRSIAAYGSLGESEYSCGWAGSNSGVMLKVT